MITTTIAYARGKQVGEPDGPVTCTRCTAGLLHRTSDRVEDSVDASTNAELTLHIWEHDCDDEGRALCPSCFDIDEQTEVWRQIVAWKWRSEARSHILSNRGVELFEDYRSVVMFAAEGGKLDVGAVLAFVGRDPLRPGASQPPRFDLIAGAMHEATMEMGENLRNYTRADSDADELECPKTERNDER